MAPPSCERLPSPSIRSIAKALFKSYEPESGITNIGIESFITLTILKFVLFFRQFLGENCVSV